MANGDDVIVKKTETGWHMDRRVSIAHILTTIAMTLALAAWIFALAERITVNEIEISAMKQRDHELMVRMEQHYLEIVNRLERIEDRLNEHMDRRP